MPTVLIADDDSNTRLLVRTVLSHAGHQVIEAQNGLRAIESARADVPDLILLDLSMPGMSGADFLRALRSDSRTRRTVVALYTATPMNAAMRDFTDMYGIREVIPKPCEPAELIATVERALAPR